MTQRDENSAALLRGPETSHKLTHFLTNVRNVRSGAERVAERRSKVGRFLQEFQWRPHVGLKGSRAYTAGYLR